MELAKEHISKAFTLNKNLRLLALDDEGLEGCGIRSEGGS
jgi:hypothetical protein